MKQTLKVIAIIELVFGGIACLAAIAGTSDNATFFAGLVWIAFGWAALAYISENKSKPTC